ncbi:uncharacterized protein isoform X2 [Rhodnius prolixus]|uniref:uncharacterized protein isoform X2 n=1 Tax=Rhodnius prolixus TaxID=13249 RepID=UPI003D18D3BE
MNPDKVEEVAKKTVSYFKKRRYIVGDVYLNRDTEVSKRKSELLDFVDSASSGLNIITSLSSVAYEISHAEQQFTSLETWISENLDDRQQADLTPMLMPVLCHLYLDALRIHPKQDCINFFMMFSLRLITEEWYPCVEQLLNVPSASDLSRHPLVKAFRESKFRLKLTHDTLVLLRKFLSVRDLNIIIAILQTWFEFAEEEDEESDDDNLESSRFDEGGSSEDESPVRTYKGHHTKKVEELMKEINPKRLQSTPPPPLLLYTAYRTEGIVCGRISEEHYLAATGDKRSEVRIWGLGENRISPKLHESYFQSVPLGEVDSDTDSECPEPYDIATEEIHDFEPQPSTSQIPSLSRITQESFLEPEKQVDEEVLDGGSDESESSESLGPENEFLYTTLDNMSKSSPMNTKPKIDIDHLQSMSSPGGFSNDQDSVFNADNGETLGLMPSQQMWPLRGHSDAVYDVAFLPNCEYLLSVSFDTTMRLWNLSDFSCPVVYRGHSSPVWSVAVSTIANYVATASSDKTAKLWCLDRTFPVRVMAGHLQAVTSVAFHPNGSYLATGSPDRTVRLWSITDGAMVRVMGGFPDMGAVETLAFSPNGQYVASAETKSKTNLSDGPKHSCRKEPLAVQS